MFLSIRRSHCMNPSFPSRNWFKEPSSLFVRIMINKEIKEKRKILKLCNIKWLHVPHSPIGSPHPKSFEFKSALEQTKQNPSGLAFSVTSTLTNKLKGHWLWWFYLHYFMVNLKMCWVFGEITNFYSWILYKF